MTLTKRLARATWATLADALAFALHRKLEACVDTKTLLQRYQFLTGQKKWSSPLDPEGLLELAPGLTIGRLKIGNAFLDILKTATPFEAPPEYPRLSASELKYLAGYRLTAATTLQIAAARTILTGALSAWTKIVGTKIDEGGPRGSDWLEFQMGMGAPWNGSSIRVFLTPRAGGWDTDSLAGEDLGTGVLTGYIGMADVLRCNDENAVLGLVQARERLKFQLRKPGRFGALLSIREAPAAPEEHGIDLLGGRKMTIRRRNTATGDYMERQPPIAHR